MTEGISKLSRVIGLVLALGLLSLISVGCGDTAAPTATPSSSGEDQELWNPQPGETINGVEVPILREGYWESTFGPEVNPFRIPPRTFRVTSAGGTFIFGLHSLTIPPDAVSSTIMLTMSAGSNNAVAIDCSPSPFTFDQPITMSLSYFGTQYQDMNDPPLHIYYMATDGSLEEMPSTINNEAQAVVAQTNHFSRYIVG